MSESENKQVVLAIMYGTSLAASVLLVVVGHRSVLEASGLVSPFLAMLERWQRRDRVSLQGELDGNHSGRAPR